MLPPKSFEIWHFSRSLSGLIRRDLTTNASMSGPSAEGGVLVYGEANEGEAVATIRKAIDLGVNFLDTAEV
jgi:aryl-alcohol dehydrogenase-like predicted oxidoreductase